ncbi:MAG TPA: acyltransferase [Mucilaginibacter sp.]|jgi:surface polysaccharide O-acyltransferase-like enzyme
MKNERVYYYDLIKSIAIYLVCFYHYGLPNINFIESPQYSAYFDYFLQGISSIGVPLFFMVNGALLLNKVFDIKKHIYKIISICLLYVIWGAITLLIEALIFGDHYTIVEFLKAIYYTKEGRTSNLWFLAAMIYIYVLFPLIKSLFDKNEKVLANYLWIMIFLFTFGVVFINDLVNIFGYFFNISRIKNKQIGYFPWFNPFNIYFSYTLIYFITGGWIVKFFKHVQFKIIPSLLLFLLSGCLLFLFGLMKTNISGEVYDTVWHGYNSIMTLTMAITVFILCSRIKINSPKVKKVIATVSTNTLGIYLIHAPIGNLLGSFYWKLWLSNYLIFNLGFVFLILLLSLIISLIISRIPLFKNLVKI